MSKPTIPVILTVALIWGCSHSVPLRHNMAENYHQVNENAAHHKTVITLSEGGTIKTSELHMAQDSTTFIVEKTGVLQQVATISISKVTIFHTGKGAMEGMLTGLTMGAAIGAAIGFADGDDEQGWFSYTAEEKALVGAVGLGGLGLIIGLPVGAGVASKDVYHFETLHQPYHLPARTPSFSK